MIYILSAAATCAQSTSDDEARPSVNPLRSTTIFPTNSGNWIGFDRGVLASRIIYYDSSFSELRQAHWKFLPLDFASHFDPKKSLSAGLILGVTRNRVTLYEIDFDELRLEPLWEAEEIRNPQRILAIPGVGVLVYGKYGALLLDSAYQPGTRIESELLTDPLLYKRDSLFFIHRDIAGVHARWMDASTLEPVAEKTLGPERSEVEISVRYPAGPKDQLTYTVALRESSTVFVVDPRVRRLPPTPLHSSFPDLITLSTIGQKRREPVPVGIHAGYPIPRIITGEHPEGRRLHYPITEPPTAAYGIGSSILLIASDSVVLYDSDFNYVNSQPVPGSNLVRLYSLQDSIPQILYVSDEGTTTLSLEREPINWVREYGPTVALFIALFMAALAVLMVTERYRRMRAIFRALVTGTSAAGVMIFSKRGRLVRANHQALDLLGLPDSTPLGRHLLSYFQAPELGDIREELRSHLSGGIPLDRQVSIEGDEGSRTVRLLLRRMTGRYGSNRGTLLALEDLTEQVERERLLNWASVAHHIAHEMKTPLGTIRTSADMLRGELLGSGAEDQSLSMLGRIIRQASRLREIVEDLLTVARSDSLVLNRVDLVILLRALADDMREYLPPTCTIRVETSNDSCPMQLDADQLAVALRNLLDNARQAIGSRENGLIECRLLCETDRARITVRDNGIGMSDETKRRLFQPFYSEKEGGSGIGTTILKRVIEGHGGRIEVQSEPGQGATFEIELPARGDTEGETGQDLNP